MINILYYVIVEFENRTPALYFFNDKNAGLEFMNRFNYSPYNVRVTLYERNAQEEVALVAKEVKTFTIKEQL